MSKITIEICLQFYLNLYEGHYPNVIEQIILFVKHDEMRTLHESIFIKVLLQQNI
jgi:hypothetical protein